LKKCVPRKCCGIRWEKPSAIWLQRDAAGVGGDDGVGFAELLHFAPETALDFQILGDGFDDPVAVGDTLARSSSKLPGVMSGGVLVDEESAGRCLAAFSMPLSAAALRLGWIGKNDIEQ
jgi:hypothetical protein